MVRIIIIECLRMIKPKDRCPKHKRAFTIYYRHTGELICSKCKEILIKAKKIKKTLTPK